MVNPKNKIFLQSEFFQDELPVVVRRHKHDPKSFYPPEMTKQRQFWEILYVAEGTGILRINHREYPFRPGFICLLHPNDQTNLVTDDSIDLFHVLFLLDAVDDDLARLYNDSNFFSIFHPEFRPERSISHEQLHLIDSNRQIFQDIRQMYRECNHGDANTGEMLRFMLLKLLVEFSRLGVRLFRRRRRQKTVTGIDNYLREHFSEPFRSEAVAREVGISQRYLSNFYRRATGSPLQKRLLEIRIEEAKKLLTGSDLPVEVICRQCGFSDRSNFYKVFRRETGVPPGVFRRNAGKSKCEEP